MRKNEKLFSILIIKSEEKRPLGRPSWKQYRSACEKNCFWRGERIQAKVKPRDLVLAVSSLWVSLPGS